jgi:hypothetical protein
VQLVERLKPPDEPFYNHVVSLKVYSGGQLIAEEPRFSGGSDFDQRFGEAHPEHNWVTDNLLRLGKKPLTVKTKYDEILIRNNAAATIAYLMINAGSDLFLLFDLHSNATTKVIMQSQTAQGADSSWMGYAGQFANGKRIKASGLTFDVKDKYRPAARYCITIRDDEVVVRGRDFEGISFQGGIERRIPVASDCSE